MKLPFSHPDQPAVCRACGARLATAPQWRAAILAAAGGLRGRLQNWFCVTNRHAVLRPGGPRATAAFTMIEIALCLAIVGFALVAIIGVLPAGLNVQKENREDTILNHDASVWLDALRSGSFGYDELANYVDRVVVSSQNFDSNNAPMGPIILTVAERNAPNMGDNRIAFNNSGGLIVGLLSTPRVVFKDPTVTGVAYTTNYVYAYARSFSGNAAEKSPQNNADVKDLAFAYRMVVETASSAGSRYESGGTLTNASDINVANGFLSQNFHDVRLLFRWPLKTPFQAGSANDPVVGNSRLVFRTQLSGRFQGVQDSTYPNVPLYFLQPRDYQ